MTYPFQFTQWTNLSYKGKDTETWTAFSKKWVVGMISLKQFPEEKRVHLFHLYVNKQNRNQGIEQKLICKIEERTKENNLNMLTLNAVQGNSQALSLYEKIGFKMIKLKNKKIEMEKIV